VDAATAARVPRRSPPRVTPPAPSRPPSRTTPSQRRTTGKGPLCPHATSPSPATLKRSNRKEGE
jgi:hypothetical protein